MSEYKIVFTGTVGAGKTTAISTISETPPVITDVANTDKSVEKAQTTVGLDFGVINLPNGDRVRLFGTPGQERFDFMWKILIKDAFGLVILIDNTRPSPISDMEMYLRNFEEEIKAIPCVIGVGRMTDSSPTTIDDFATSLEAFNFVLPIIPVDVRRIEDVNLLIQMLLAQAEASSL